MIDIALVSHQGTRHYMEDTSCIVKNFGGRKGWIFGGVFDGHNGDETAKFAAKHLPRFFLKQLKEGMNEEEAFKISYQEISDQKEFEKTGCCALSFFIKGREMFVANSGDCRMIKIDGKWVDEITRDHRVSDPIEKERIIKSGGRIEMGYARKGEYEGLMPTRTLGDNYFRDIGIIAEPDVFHCDISTPPDAYLIAATDGLWDEMENEAVAEVVREARSSEEAANLLLDVLLTPQGSKPGDNITIIVART